MTNKSLNWNDNLSIRKVISLLKEGKVIVGPSDTVLGLYALPTEQGFLSLNDLKKRLKKPYILLISASSELKRYVESDYLFHIENITNRFWPGPLTIILNAKSTVPAYMTSDEGTIAVRVPKYDKLQELLAQTGPLFSTSANLAGEPIPLTLDELSPLISNKVGAIIEGKSNFQALPSTIIDATGDKLKIIREGAYSKEDLTGFL